MWLESCTFYWMRSQCPDPLRAKSTAISHHALVSPVTSACFFPLWQNVPTTACRLWAGGTLRHGNSWLSLGPYICCHLTEHIHGYVWPLVYEHLINHDSFIDFWPLIQLGPLDWGSIQLLFRLPGLGALGAGLLLYLVFYLNFLLHESKLHSWPHLLSSYISTKASYLLHSSTYPSTVQREFIVSILSQTYRKIK